MPSLSHQGLEPGTDTLLVGSTRQKEMLVAESWKRCFETYGLTPESTKQPVVLTVHEFRDARDPLEDLIEAAKPEMERIFSFLSVNQYIVTLISSDGVTLEFFAGDSLADTASEMILHLGSIWRENRQGTTGVGTCIATRKPVTILGEEHFSNRYKSATCTVAPIFDDDYQLCAALNVTTPIKTNHDTQDLVRRIVQLSAKRIQHNLFRKKHQGRALLRLSQFSDFADITLEGVLALDSDGIVTALENCGSHESDLHDFNIARGQKISDALGKSIDELIASYADNPVVKVRNSATGEDSLFAKFDLPEGERPKGPKRAYVPAATTGKLHQIEFTDELSKVCGDDVKMLRNAEVALKVSKLDLPILLLGETGTGKGTFAKAVHNASGRRDQPFVAINCAAIPENLIESELFGYRPGAFTGADPQGFKGRLLEANGGTLFLDEIGDMPTSLQTRLLRVLSEGEIVPLGSQQSVKLDIRVISATLQDLNKLVAQGAFREDLYFRLNGACLQMPALRERKDIGKIITNLLEAEAQARDLDVSMSDDFLEFLKSYFWVGNIRELKNTLSYCLAMADGEQLNKSHLPPQLQASQGASSPTGGASSDDVQHYEEREVTLQALKREKWNVSAAARLLGISRATLHRRINQMGLERADT